MDFGARYYDPSLGIWHGVDPLAVKYSTLSPYVYCANNPLFFIDPDGKKLIVTSANGNTLFTLDDGKSETTKITTEQAYARGIQWFEPTANNYMPLLSIDRSFSRSNRVLHFTWDEIVGFAEQNRPMAAYRPGGSGDWKADGKPGDGYRLVDVGGKPYWADAIGNIPFAIDKFTDELEITGDANTARQKTIEAGAKFGDGYGLKRDNSNSYDNAIIRRSIDWATKRYNLKVNNQKDWLRKGGYDLEKTDYSPTNLCH